MELENNVLFWQKLDTLVLSETVTIEHRKGAVHPKYPHLVYPVDYGYLKDIHSSVSDYIEVYVGTEKYSKVNTIMVAVDVLKKVIEVKVLLGCTEEEEKDICLFLNETDVQKSIIVRRGSELPYWALNE